MRKTVVTLIAAVAVLFYQGGYAQPIAGHDEMPSTISVGMAVQAAKKVLARAEIRVAGRKAFAAHPAGDQWLFYSLQEGQVDLVIQYSPRNERITRITVHYLTTPRSRTEIPVAASSIQFHEDGSYSIQFPSSTPRRPSKQGVIGRVNRSKQATKQPAASRRRVPVEDIGTAVLLTGRLGQPLGTMLTVSGRWGYPDLRVKDNTLRFVVTHVNAKELARPVVFPAHAVNAIKDGASAIPLHTRHRELDDVTWTLHAYETGRFTSVPAEYWRERGVPAMIQPPAFVSQLVGFVRVARSGASPKKSK